MLLSYLNYQWKAQGAHGIHSPFVFELFNEVIQDDRYFYVFDDLENLRKNLLHDGRELEVTELGAGSKVFKNSKRKVKQIAQTSLGNQKTSWFLFRLVKYFQSKHILELGTSLGLNTLYLKKSNPQAVLQTMEGCPNIAQIAQENFAQMQENIPVVVGNIDLTLEKTLEKFPQLDLVYFDANHRLEPTLRYFETCLAKSHNDTVFVLDDIHWSAEMEKAWKILIAKPEVRVSIDLFDLGLIFFRKEQVKQHFILKF